MTPFEVAARLPVGQRCVLLSSRDDDGLGKQSYVFGAPVETLALTTAQAPKARLALIEQFVADRHRRGEWVVGYLGYNLLDGQAVADGAAPVAYLAAYDAGWHWDTQQDAAGPCGEPNARPRCLGRAVEPSQLPPLPAAGPPPIQLGPLADAAPRQAHLEAVAAAQRYIVAGDVYQVNLARAWRAEVTTPGDPLALLRSLVAVAPAPYSGLIEFGTGALLSSSPELFLRQRGAAIETRPIKGTRRRDGDPAHDQQVRDDLLAAGKDHAEHVMIVDLERNDLGRVCQVGTVAVPALAYAVELPALYHLVSRVTGVLRPGVGLGEILAATFPGGSITGAPKVRAMEIIDELEAARRGPYCGAFGMFGNAWLELAIAIRVGVIADGELRVHVGGGIVADSVPASELAETDDKLAGWQAALRHYQGQS